MRNNIRMIEKIAVFIFVLPVCTIGAQKENQTVSSIKPKFEVISIRPGSLKPISPGAYGSDLKFLPGGKFITLNINLNAMIGKAYEIPMLHVIGIPKFIEKAIWDIEAVPEEGKYPLKNGLLDPDTAKLMIQSMLEDRFKLKVHQETRILPGYELVIAKEGIRLAPPKDFALLPGPENGYISRTKDLTKRGINASMPGSLMLFKTSMEHFASKLSAQFFFDGEKTLPCC